MARKNFPKMAEFCLGSSEGDLKSWGSSQSLSEAFKSVVATAADGRISSKSAKATELRLF
jgi:hypothetical protein